MWNISLTKADKRKYRELIHIGPWHKRYIALYRKTARRDHYHLLAERLMAPHGLYQRLWRLLA